MTTATLYSDIRNSFRVSAEAHAAFLRRRLPELRVLVEDAESEAFPVSVFVTLIPPSGDGDVIIELAARRRNGSAVLTAEVLLEDGEIVVPALIRRFPVEQPDEHSREAVATFVALIEPYLAASEGILQDRIGIRSLELVQAASGATAERSAQQRSLSYFTHSARRLAGSHFESEFASGYLPIRGGNNVHFDFVSADGMIVGQAKFARQDRIALSSLTEYIWQLQNVESAAVRFLVAGSTERPLNRWIERYGADAASPVELWALVEGRLERVA